MASLTSREKNELQRLGLITLALDELEDKDEEEAAASRKKHKREWTKDWLKARDDPNGPVLLYNEVQNTDLEKFVNTFRMTPDTLEQLLEKIRPQIEKQDTMMRAAVPAKVRLMITLRYLTSGANYRVLEDIFRVDFTTISKIIPDVCNALWTGLAKEYVICPSSPKEWEEKAKRFAEVWQYPRGIGAMDGKHVVVQAFANTGSTFRNYKNSFSIVLLAVADADYEIIYADIGTEGGSNDSGIYNRSDLKRAIESGQLGLPAMTATDDLEVPLHLLADDAFSLSETVMKPYPHKSLDPKERVFNYRFSRARRCVENAFGIMSSRFRVLRVPIMQKYDNAVSTVKAVVVLHNYMLRLHPPSTQEVDQARDEQDREVGRRSAGVPGQGTQLGRLYRECLANYFFTRGQVHFQWNQTFRTS